MRLEIRGKLIDIECAFHLPIQLFFE